MDPVAAATAALFLTSIVPALLAWSAVRQRGAADFRDARLDRIDTLEVLALAAVVGLGLFATAWYVVGVRPRLPERRTALVGAVVRGRSWVRAWPHSFRSSCVALWQASAE